MILMRFKLKNKITQKKLLNQKIDEAIEDIKRIFPFEGYMDNANESYKNIANSVLSCLKPGSKILDLGCGPADKPAILQKLGFECTGYDDMSDEWHNLNGNKNKIINFAKEAKVKLIISKERNEALKKESFDMLMSNDMLEHLHDSPRTLLNEFLGYLKPGGYILITVPNAVNIRKRLSVLRGETNLPDFYTYYWSPGTWRGHVREYVKNDLYLLSKYLGLNIKEIKGCDHMITSRLSGIFKKIYLLFTKLDDSLKDSWTLLAQKPFNWESQDNLEFSKYLEYLSKKSYSGFNPKKN